METKTEQCLYKCEFCGKGFSTKTSFREHLHNHVDKNSVQGNVNKSTFIILTPHSEIEEGNVTISNMIEVPEEETFIDNEVLDVLVKGL